MAAGRKAVLSAPAGQTETLFALANGFLGIRRAFEEGSPAFHHGTFVNGFHETWPIVYGEDAFGFARTGQTIVNVPDSKIIRLYVDDEPLDLSRVAAILRTRARHADRDGSTARSSGKSTQEK
jgi:alpha,alpha-trehalose phosphorylase